MSRYKTILIDDEHEANYMLQMLIEDICDEIEVIDSVTSTQQGLESVVQNEPDLLFLDIRIDDKTGFELLGELDKCRNKPYVIFVTAYEQFAIQAFRVDAIDYLLKPVERKELRRAVDKFIELKNKDEQQDFESIVNIINSKIKFATTSGYMFLNPDEIIFCESDGNYSKVYTSIDHFLLISSNLGSLHQNSLGDNFLRISRFSVINPKYLSMMKKKEKIVVLSYNNEQVELSFNPRYLKGVAGL